MKNNGKQRSHFHLILWPFIIFGLVCFLIYEKRKGPSATEICQVSCMKEGKRGRMTHVFRAEVTAGMRSKGPQRCECY